MTWQPIETAPRDGTKILAYIGNYSSKTTNRENCIQIIYWAEDDTDETFKVRMTWRQDFDGPLRSYIRMDMPTHWMPLPACPPTGE